MARNYVTGRWELPDGPVPGVGGVEQLDIADTQSLRFGDNEVLYFGDAFDVGIKWNGSNLLVLPVADHTGQILIGNGVLSMDVKAFGSSSGNYVWWMSDADALYLYITSKTVVDEDHALDITFNGTVAAGADQMVGLNVAVVPAGAHGGWASAIYGKVTMPAGGRPIDGYVTAAELEVIHTAGVAVQCAYYILNLNENNGGVTVSAVRAYIGLNDYSVAAYRQPNLFSFNSAAGKVTPADDDVILTEPGVVLGGTFNVAVRNRFGATPFWLLGTTTAPESFADLKVMGSTVNNYLEWDASADRLNVVVAGRTCVGEEHAVDISVISTIAAGDSVVGLNVAVAPVGTVASWLCGIYAKVTTAQAVSGYCDAAEFECIAAGSQNLPAHYVLGLNFNETNTGSQNDHRAFLFLNSYGTRPPHALFEAATGFTLADHDSGQMIVETAAAKTHNVSIRFLLNGVAYWLMATSEAPS